MIRVSTDSDVVDLHAKPEGVTVENTRLTIRRGSEVVGVFRRWEYWHEVPAPQ